MSGLISMGQGASGWEGICTSSVAMDMMAVLGVSDEVTSRRWMNLGAVLQVEVSNREAIGG